MGLFFRRLGADELDGGVGTGDQTAEGQVAEHSMDGDRGRQDIFEGLPHGADKDAIGIDPDRAHHEAGPTVGQLHDGGTENIEQKADEDVGRFQVLDHQ